MIAIHIYIYTCHKMNKKNVFVIYNKNDGKITVFSEKNSTKMSWNVENSVKTYHLKVCTVKKHVILTWFIFLYTVSFYFRTFFISFYFLHYSITDIPFCYNVVWMWIIWLAWDVAVTVRINVMQVKSSKLRHFSMALYITSVSVNYS